MENILNQNNTEEAKEILKKAIDIGIDFKLNFKVNEKHFDKDSMEELLKIPKFGEELPKILEQFKNEVLPVCTNFSNVKFMGFPDAGNSIAGLTGAVLSDFLQQNLINSSFCAPIATFLEIAVIKWLREIIGYDISNINNICDTGGIITYGGTGSNATAMLLARENYHKNTMVNGVINPSEYKVIIPKGIGHYSISSSLMWLGCGNSIIEVDTIGFKYNINELERVLKENKGNVMCVVVYVGDSRTMTIDNLSEIYNLVKKIDNKIWLHADACHGFSLAFSDKLKYKIEGLNLYDSISIDPHKVLAIPYCISALLIKEPQKIKSITSSSDLIMKEEFAFGQITPFIGSKSWVSLKLWFAIKNFGIKGFEKMIDRRYEMANYFKNQILKSSDFVLLNSVDINSVVFMYVIDNQNIRKLDVDYINKLNNKIYNYILKDGKYYLHQFLLTDNNDVIKKDVILIPLRYMSGNDNITSKEIDSMIDYIRNVGREINE